MRVRDLGSALETRRGTVDRIHAAGAQYFHVTGEIEAGGIGEATHTVNFPCLFTEKPRWYYGPELGPGQTITEGQLPVGNMTLLIWHETVRDDGTVIYSGATFGMVSSGPIGQVIIFQYHVSGIGLRNPVPGVEGDA